MTDAAIAMPRALKSQLTQAGRLFVIFMGPSLGGLAPLGLALDQAALAGHFGDGGLAMAGTIFTAPSLAIIFGAPLGGYLAERFGYRLTLLVALLVYGITGVAGLVTDGYGPLLASRLVLGLAAGTVMAIYLALASAYFEGTARAKVLGFAVACSAIVGALALYLGGLLVDLAGWRGPFALYLLGFATLFAAWATVKGPFQAPVRAARAAGGPGMLTVIAQLWPIYGVLLIISIGTFMPSAGGPFLLKANGIAAAKDQGAILSAGSTPAIFTAAAYGFARRWFSDWSLFILVPATMGIGLTAAVPMHAVALLVTTFVIIGLGTGFKAPVAGSILMASAPPNIRAAAGGLSFSCIFLGQFLDPPLIRLLTGPLGMDIHGAFLAIGAALILVAATIAVAGIGKTKADAL